MWTDLRFSPVSQITEPDASRDVALQSIPMQR